MELYMIKAFVIALLILTTSAFCIPITIYTPCPDSAQQLFWRYKQVRASRSNRGTIKNLEG
jgi:hypothetical protein